MNLFGTPTNLEFTKTPGIMPLSPTQSLPQFETNSFTMGWNL